jgi:hypothetical protein
VSSVAHPKMMFMKVIAKRRRILVHLATCSFLVYLLYQLRRNGDDLGHRVHHRAARDKDDDASGILPTDFVREELKRLFKKADTTADGLVSKKELSWSISRYFYFIFNEQTTNSVSKQNSIHIISELL